MKKICIIGAGSGIGQALVKYYMQEGYQVDTVTREDTDLEVQDQRDLLYERVSKGNYDIVIYSAGIGYHKIFSNLKKSEITQQIVVNTLAPLELLSSIPPRTKFVYLSSVMQHISAKNMSVYAASKRAVSQSLAAIESENNSFQTLRVDLGAVKTDMHIKAGMKKKVGREIDTVIPKLVTAIEKKRGTTTLFWDWWIMIYFVFPLYRLFLFGKNIGNKF